MKKTELLIKDLDILFFKTCLPCSENCNMSNINTLKFLLQNCKEFTNSDLSVDIEAILHINSKLIDIPDILDDPHFKTFIHAMDRVLNVYSKFAIT